MTVLKAQKILVKKYRTISLKSSAELEQHIVNITT